MLFLEPSNGCLDEIVARRHKNRCHSVARQSQKYPLRYAIRLLALGRDRMGCPTKGSNPADDSQTQFLLQACPPPPPREFPCGVRRGCMGLSHVCIPHRPTHHQERLRAHYTGICQSPAEQQPPKKTSPTRSPRPSRLLPYSHPQPNRATIRQYRRHAYPVLEDAEAVR